MYRVSFDGDWIVFDRQRVPFGAPVPEEAVLARCATADEADAVIERMEWEE